MEQVPRSELMDHYHSQNEAIYHSNIREPLGASYNRGHQLPTKTESDEFKFGISTQTSENAKKLIYYDEALPDQRIAPAAPDRDPMFHKERDITRQIDRQYDWQRAGVDPVRTRFGRKVPVDDEDNVKSVMDTSAPTAKIGSKRVNEIRNYSHDRLGQQRELRGTLKKLGSDFVFGRFNTPDEWGARKCINGQFPQDEQMPDRDLGTSIRKLNPLETTPFDQAHIYGTPSVRADLAVPRLRSVADPKNYGDEHNAKGLLYPSKYAYDGVEEEEFLQARAPQEVREIFAKMGMSFSDSTFERLCEMAVRDFGALSVDSLRHAYNKHNMDMSSRSRPTSRSGSASGRRQANRGACLSPMGAQVVQ